MAPTSTASSTSPTMATPTEATFLVSSNNKLDGEASIWPQSPTTTATATTTNMPPLSDQNASLNRARRWMYVSHAMNQFSEWAWQFCLILFLAALTNYQSLLLVSTYGVTLNAFVAYGLPRMGRLVDRAAAATASATNTSLLDNGTNHAPRLTLIRLWILLENICVLLATACCWYLFQQHHHQQQPSLPTLTGQDEKPFELWVWLQSSSSSSSWILSTILLVGMHVLGAMAQVLDKSVLLALERDWVVVMSTEYAHQLDSQNHHNENNNDDTIDDRQNDGRDEEHMDREASSQIQQHNSSIKNGDANKKDPRSLWLSQTNVIMKQIDLSCQISAPALSGWFIAYWTTASSSLPDSSPSLAMAEGQQQYQPQQDWSGAVFWVGTVNVVALIVEWICLTHIYHMVPALAAATAPSETVTPLTGRSSFSISDEDDDDDNDQSSNKRTVLEPTPEKQGTPDAKVPSRTSSSSPSVSSSRCYDFAGHALHVYFCEQSTTVSMSGLGLSFLYFNVLTFGGMMTAYLITLGGMSITTIGFWRGVSSAIGLAGTLAFDVSHRILGYSLEFTGLWSVIWEFVCLSISVLSLVWLTTDPHRSMVLLIAGVLPSRIGLYAFDITITTLMQERVAPSVRGLVGGTQTSLNSWMSLLPYGMGMIYSEPRQFHVFVVGCYVAVGLAMILYIVGVYGVCGRLPYPRAYQSLS